jgi:hypothetical protein
MMAWAVELQDGAVTIVREEDRNLTFKECVDILDYRGYSHTEIKSMTEVVEEN